MQNLIQAENKDKYRKHIEDFKLEIDKLYELLTEHEPRWAESPDAVKAIELQEITFKPIICPEFDNDYASKISVIVRGNERMYFVYRDSEKKLFDPDSAEFLTKERLIDIVLFLKAPVSTSETSR